jgi:murein DD-endopeptidase MepM/ murein hydrolase activator NlpD
MTIYTKQQQYQLLEAVRDCITYSLTEREALAYIKNRTGLEISRRHYYNIKDFAQSEPSTQLWLSQFTKLGFVTEHRKHIDEVNKARAEMWRMILKEQIRPAEQQDKFLIAKLYSQIHENIKLASALNLGTPVVAQIKAMVDKASNNNESNSLYYNRQDIQSSSSIQAGPKDPSLY